MKNVEILILLVIQLNTTITILYDLTLKLFTQLQYHISFPVCWHWSILCCCLQVPYLTLGVSIKQQIMAICLSHVSYDYTKWLDVRYELKQPMILTM